MKAQVLILKEKADEWGQLIRDGWLPRQRAWEALRRTIWASLKYPLVATTITRQQGDEIVGDLYRMILTSLGADWNSPKAVRYAPRSMLGLDMPHPYVHRGIEQLNMCLVHGHLDTPTGKLIRASLEQAQLEADIGTPLFEAPIEDYGFLVTDCWIKSVWAFVSKDKLSLRTNHATPHLLREQDFLLMQRLVEVLHCLKASGSSKASCSFWPIHWKRSVVETTVKAGLTQSWLNLSVSAELIERTLPPVLFICLVYVVASAPISRLETDNAAQDSLSRSKCT